MEASPKKPLLSDFHLLLAFSAACCLSILFVQVDKAIAWSWPNNPYSPLWFWLNPLAWADVPYRIELACFQAIAFGSMIWFTRWSYRPLPFKVAFVQIVVQTIFVMVHWQENITVTAFAWVAWYLWPWILMLVQKLPVGWSWNLQDAHVKCLSTCYFLNGNQVAASVLDSFIGRDLFHYFIYALCLFAFLYPVHVRKSIVLRAKSFVGRLL